MATVISFACKKGGVGKTTVSINSAIFLANSLEKPKVLFIDADPQGNSTLELLQEHNPTFTEFAKNNPDYIKNIKLDPEYYYKQNIDIPEPTIFKDYIITETGAKGYIPEFFDVLFTSTQNRADFNPSDYVYQTNYENLSILPTFPNRDTLSTAYSILTGEKQKSLRALIEHYKKEYDFILVDTAPANGVLEQRFLSLSDYVIGITTGKSFTEDGIIALINTIDNLQEENFNVKFETIVLNAFNGSMNTDLVTRARLLTAVRQEAFENLIILPQDQSINTIVSLEASNGFESKNKLQPHFQEIVKYILSKKGA